jgi:hypothetical protein
MFTDYFESAWRTGSTQSPILVEATYFFPELAAALEDLPAKSQHQGEIADRLAIVKANVDSLVFYVTLASGADPIDALDPAKLLNVTDGDGHTYAVRDWVEANAVLLPTSNLPQRIGLLVVDLTANNGKTLQENNPDTLSLTATGLSKDAQTLRWNLPLLSTFVRSYER